MTRILILVLLLSGLLMGAPAAHAAFPMQMAQAPAVAQHKGLTPFFAKLGALAQMPRQMMMTRKFVGNKATKGDGIVYGSVSLVLAALSWLILVIAVIGTLTLSP
jgi:hypothetical protein